MMKSNLWLIFAAIIGLSALTRGQEWEWQNPLPQGNDLNDAVWMTENTLLAVGDYSTILRSTDAGLTWAVSGQNSTEAFRAISRVDDQTAWVVGRYGTVLVTTDGGLTWQSRHDSSDVDISGMNAIDFENATTGWVGGYGRPCDEMWHTTDGGQSWIDQELPGCAGIRGIDFVNDSIGWAVGSYMIRRTTDGGANWVEQVWYDSTDEYHYYVSLDAVDFTDELNGWVVGDRVLHTTDGGQTWTGADTSGWGGVDVEFSTPQTGVLVSVNRVYLTPDGGESWMEIDPEARHYVYGGLSAVGVRDTSTMMLVGEGGEVLRSENGGMTWQLLTAELVSGFQDVCFVDSLYGWAVGDNYNDASIVHTTDGGQTWMVQPTNPPSSLEGVFFLDHFRGWTVGFSGRLFRTVDGGQTWLYYMIPDFYPVYQDVYFLDSLNGWAAGQSESIVHSTDGGVTWSVQHSNGSTEFHDVYFADTSNGWVVGESEIWRTTNGGESWTPQFSNADIFLLQASFVNPWTGWAAGGDFSEGPASGAILKTTDGGQNWVQDERDYPYFRGIEFFNHQIGWAIRPTYELYRTLDGGETWTPIPTGTDNWIGALSFGAVNKVWAVGDNGTILHLTDTITTANDYFIPHPSSFILSIFPNPFNSSTRLSYDIPRNGQVNLAVYDLTGRLVQTLEDRVIPQGQHTLIFDGSALPSGVYFVRLQSKSFAQTQKLLLLK